MISGEVVKAWDIAVQTMERNELAVFYCQPTYAYGKAGKPPKVPADTPVIFEIELYSWRGSEVILVELFCHQSFI